MKISEVILIYRRRSGLSQTELATKIGTVKQAISEIENGKRNVGVNMAAKLFCALDIPSEVYGEAMKESMDEAIKEVSFV
ncbi:MAG: helix-turn-helix transcriptional regulator [Spirochaetales bacterium]|nr:helix-turn-helix transcriptional regulator [Spirochaetales bacterium]